MRPELNDPFPENPLQGVSQAVEEDVVDLLRGPKQELSLGTSPGDQIGRAGKDLSRSCHGAVIRELVSKVSKKSTWEGRAQAVRGPWGVSWPSFDKPGERAGSGFGVVFVSALPY